MPIRNEYVCQESGRKWYTDGLLRLRICPICRGPVEFTGPKRIRPNMSDVGRLQTRVQKLEEKILGEEVRG